jgi:hypothetical protein
MSSSVSSVAYPNIIPWSPCAARVHAHGDVGRLLVEVVSTAHVSASMP